MKLIKITLKNSALSATALCLTLFMNTSFASSSDAEISDITWRDSKFLEKQRASVDELGRSNYGTPVRNNLDDLRLLQRIIDDGLIKKDDKQGLQALGATLGDLYAQHRQLEWKVYLDDIGRSKAVCVKNTNYCIFPITMLSRRIEAGATPDVKRVYDKGLTLIKPFMPKVAFETSLSE